MFILSVRSLVLISSELIFGMVVMVLVLSMVVGVFSIIIISVLWLMVLVVSLSGWVWKFSWGRVFVIEWWLIGG